MTRNKLQILETKPPLLVKNGQCKDCQCNDFSKITQQSSVEGPLTKLILSVQRYSSSPNNDWKEMTCIDLMHKQPEKIKIVYFSSKDNLK